MPSNPKFSAHPAFDDIANLPELHLRHTSFSRGFGAPCYYRLLQVLRGRRDIDEHERLGVATQAWLEKVGEARVSVRHMRLLVRKRADHVTAHEPASVRPR